MRNLAGHPEKIFLVEGFYDKGSHLLLYDDPGDKHRFMASFLQRGLERGEFCCHVYPGGKEGSKLCRHLGDVGENVLMIPMSRKKLSSLSVGIIKSLRHDLEELGQRFNKHMAVRLQLDFGMPLRNGSMGLILDLEKWTHSWGVRRFTTMSVFNMSILAHEEAQELVRLHERSTLSTKKGTSVFFAGDSHPSIKILSEKNMEEWIKKCLDVLVLSLLQQRPMCGIDIIKTISRSFGVELSQGMVYPLLYTLKENGYVDKVIEADNKTRVYVPTRRGRRFMNKKLKGYILAQSTLLSFINNTPMPPSTAWRSKGQGR